MHVASSNIAMIWTFLATIWTVFILLQGPVSGKNFFLSSLVTLGMEKKTVAKMISELKSVSRLIFFEKVAPGVIF